LRAAFIGHPVQAHQHLADRVPGIERACGDDELSAPRRWFLRMGRRCVQHDRFGLRWRRAATHKRDRGGKACQANTCGDRRSRDAVHVAALPVPVVRGREAGNLAA
jgi:hypothetical protein